MTLRHFGAAAPAAVTASHSTTTVAYIALSVRKAAADSRICGIGRMTAISLLRGPGCDRSANGAIRMNL